MTERRSGERVGKYLGPGLSDAAAPIRQQLERAAQKVAGLQSELVELRISEKVAIAQAADLRQRLDAAEQRASEEHDRAERASARVQELTRAMAEKAAKPPEPEPPRTRWQRFKAWRRRPA